MSAPQSSQPMAPKSYTARKVAMAAMALALAATPSLAQQNTVDYCPTGTLSSSVLLAPTADNRINYHDGKNCRVTGGARVTYAPAYSGFIVPTLSFKANTMTFEAGSALLFTPNSAGANAGSVYIYVEKCLFMDTAYVDVSKDFVLNRGSSITFNSNVFNLNSITSATRDVNQMFAVRFLADLAFEQSTVSFYRNNVTLVGEDVSPIYPCAFYVRSTLNKTCEMGFRQNNILLNVATSTDAERPIGIDYAASTIAGGTVAFEWNIFNATTISPAASAAKVNLNFKTRRNDKIVWGKDFVFDGNVVNGQFSRDVVDVDITGGVNSASIASNTMRIRKFGSSSDPVQVSLSIKDLLGSVDCSVSDNVLEAENYAVSLSLNIPSLPTGSALKVKDNMVSTAVAQAFNEQRAGAYPPCFVWFEDKLTAEDGAVVSIEGNMFNETGNGGKMIGWSKTGTSVRDLFICDNMLNGEVPESDAGLEGYLYQLPQGAHKPIDQCGETRTTVGTVTSKMADSGNGATNAATAMTWNFGSTAPTSTHAQTVEGGGVSSTTAPSQTTQGGGEPTGNVPTDGEVSSQSAQPSVPTDAVVTGPSQSTETTVEVIPTVPPMTADHNATTAKPAHTTTVVSNGVGARQQFFGMGIAFVAAVFASMW